jgi:copper chaperone CopZ
MVSDRTFLVDGMSCEHCEHAVGRAVTALAGVESVDVRLEVGEVSVVGGVIEVAVRGAIADAGYEVTGVR